MICIGRIIVDVTFQKQQMAINVERNIDYEKNTGLDFRRDAAGI